jgi:hypothetical protein
VNYSHLPPDRARNGHTRSNVTSASVPFPDCQVAKANSRQTQVMARDNLAIRYWGRLEVEGEVSRTLLTTRTTVRTSLVTADDHRVHVLRYGYAMTRALWQQWIRHARPDGLSKGDDHIPAPVISTPRPISGLVQEL